MSAQSRAVRRFSFLLTPAGIVIGYFLALFAAVAISVTFPFSNLSMGLLFILVGAFFAVAIPVIVLAWLFITLVVFRALLGLGHRLIFGSDQGSGWQRTIKPCPVEKDVEPEATAAGLWDLWIDGL
jgi:hypothetical protein